MASPTNMNSVAYTDVSAYLPSYWAEKTLMDAEAQEYWASKEGPEGSKSEIIRRDGKLNQNGSKETFNTVSELMGAGVEDETELRGSEEKVTIGEFELTVGILRHAVSFTEKTLKRSLVDYANLAQPLLSRWLARRKDSNLDYQLLTTDSPTTLYANDATSVSTLDSDCTFGWNELERGMLELESMGAEPIEVQESNGEIYPCYAVCITEYDYHHLRNDAIYIKAQAEANLRGLTNPFFTRAVGKLLNGCVIHVRRGIKGKQGTRLRPEARLYGTNLIGATTLVVGADNGKCYTQYFPSTGTLSITGVDGVTEFVTYTGKTNYSFTGCTRGATYGGVASSAAAYTGVEMVTLYKHVSHQIFYGAGIAFRAFTSEFKPIEQYDDYKMQRGIGIMGEFGQKAIKDSDGNNRNYIIMKSNSHPPLAADYSA
jgi:N4-gp56 family major capsid protein